MKEISVVIPTKDRLQFLQRAIPVYLEQPEVGEIIVVIDGSIDGTSAYLQEAATRDDRIRFIDNGNNKGIPYSRNKGIEAARCAYIFSTEDDLEITSGFFTVLLDHLRRTNGGVIAGRNIFRLEDESAEAAIERTNRLVSEPINRRSIEINTSVAITDDQQQLLIASPMLARAEVFRKLRFDERYKVNFWREESDFQLSAQEAGYALISCPHAICFNFVIKKDRSGVHAAIGFKRALWVIINNWRFVNKHSTFIAQHFKIGNRYRYITLFAIKRIFVDCVLPLLVSVKSKLLSRHRLTPQK